MTGWEDDKRWSDRFLPEIKQILGLHLIAEPPVEEDQRHNTDLTVLKMDTIRVGCRVRKYDYLVRFGDEFTVRTTRPSGTQTELSKIIEGWGQYLFYGFSDIEERSLAEWRLIDLNVFRLWLFRHMWLTNGRLPGINRKNRDGSSGFYAFKVHEGPEDLIKASGGNTDWPVTRGTVNPAVQAEHNNRSTA